MIIQIARAALWGVRAYSRPTNRPKERIERLFLKKKFVEEMKLSERLRANCLVTARNGFDLVVSFIRLYCKCICIGIKSFKKYTMLFINRLSISSKYLSYKKKKYKNTIFRSHCTLFANDLNNDSIELQAAQ